MRTAILAAALLAAACGRQSSIVINLPGGPGATRAEPVRTLPAGREPAVVLESHAGSVTLRAAPPPPTAPPPPSPSRRPSTRRRRRTSTASGSGRSRTGTAP